MGMLLLIQQAVHFILAQGVFVPWSQLHEVQAWICEGSAFFHFLFHFLAWRSLYRAHIHEYTIRVLRDS